jgi:hypothetical protein
MNVTRAVAPPTAHLLGRLELRKLTETFLSGPHRRVNDLEEQLTRAVETELHIILIVRFACTGCGEHR